MFTYSAPTSIEEVLDALSEWESRARILAGGQSLMPLINSGRLRPEHLIDINHVKSLDFVDLQDSLSVGACCRQQDLETLLRDRNRHALLAQALPLIADREIRVRGTVCGSLAAAVPGAELPAVALTCDARVQIRSKRGTREASAKDLYRQDGAVALEADEILTSVVFPECESSGAAIEEIRYTQLSFPACGAAVLVNTEDGICSSLRIAVFGQGIPAQRIAEVESLAEGEKLSTHLIEELALRIRKEVRVDSVPGIPADYARQVAGSLGARAFNRAVERCRALAEGISR